MQKVTAIEVKNDKNGNPMKITSFDNGVKVFVNSKYDALIYEKVVEDAEFELTKDGDFNKIKYDKPVNPNAGKTKMVEQAQERKAEYIKEAQETKFDSIKLAGASRDATLLTVEWTKNQPFPTDDEIKRKWIEWRDWFYKQDKPLPY